MTHFVSAGSVVITPPLGLPLAGYSDERQADSVHDDLEINIIVCRQRDNALVLVSVDALFVSEELVAELETVGARFGIGGERILVVASHTHFAPALDNSKPALGMSVPSYSQSVTLSAARLLQDLLAAEGVECRLELLRGSQNLVVNRRRAGWYRFGWKLRRAVEMRPNPAAPKDQSLEVLRFVDVRRSVTLAAAWRLACHPVCFPHRRSVSADFPGAVRLSFRRITDALMPVVFLQGCAGDQRPHLLGRPASPIQLLDRVIGGPSFWPAKTEHYEQWIEHLRSCAVSIMKRDVGEHIEGPYKAALYELPLQGVVDGVGATDHLTVQIINFGSRLRIIAISGELVFAYNELLRSGTGESLVLGYSRSVWGYIPTERMVGEGGYEVTGFVSAFGLDGKRIKPDIEAAVRSLVDRAVRASSEPTAT